MTESLATMPLADAPSAVAAVAAKLLSAKGARDLALLVERSSMTLAPGSESWQVGSRTVEAHRLALVVAPDDFVRLRVRERDLDEIRWAVASVVRSATTELTELLVVVRLPVLEVPWSAAYRTAPMAADDSNPEGVITAAAALAEAYGDKRAAAVLRRGVLEMVDVPDEWISQRRVVVRLLPADLVATERDSGLDEMLRKCVTHAATRASARVLTVEIRLRSGE